MIRRIIFIPVWLLTLCIKPFLPWAHPWRHQKLTLESWIENGTEEAYMFSVVFWVQGITVAVVALRLYLLRG